MPDLNHALRITISSMADPESRLRSGSADIATITSVGISANGIAMGLALGLYIGIYHEDVSTALKEEICRLMTTAKGAPSMETTERAFFELAEKVAAISR